MAGEEVLIPDQLCILRPAFSILGVEKGVCDRYEYDLCIALAAPVSPQMTGPCNLSRSLHSSEGGQPARAPDFGKRRARMGLAVASSSHGARQQSQDVAHRREKDISRGSCEGDLDDRSAPPNPIRRKVVSPDSFVGGIGYTPG
jgi:hypothetical protein